ncbi:PIN domain-containing protein [Coraliomargarita algicola]|uniref:PIN domain-containing protein n=2 Tax=Coraliomargaritaceae TaxID=3056371 RepID=A0ABU1AYJ0_9BACT|nr:MULTISPECIES: PIN domain-containing protein [unclassified Coraliomargarita]MDQ8209178.1 PIN domain-containing protein [Coraliomargarita sp. SDUM461003]WPJ97313.1 PIN domain-containing protein [Coraliomargarita sp. J2-16]
MSAEHLMGRVLVDTNVLIYATLAGDDRHEQARDVLDLRFREGLELCVSVQNLAEMYPNLTGPKNNPPDSPELARTKIDSIAGLDFLTVLPLSLSITRRALRLCETYSIRRQQYFDMQLVGTMLEEGISFLLTEKVKDFKPIKGIRAINPFTTVIS